MLYPMFIMVILTFVILLFTLRVRISSIRKGDVSLSYYSLFEGQEVPEMVTKTRHHFANLFEVPVLFYSAGILYVALELTDPFPVYCAWVFVGARLIHTSIHLGYNNVLHRLVAFGIGNLAVLAMWLAIVSAAT
ncbi:MAG: MAPEG family protein [Proteobacteria bacterium]|jgi:hypothetical protein|nr:MAPEG family protein [Pseudomonadota bacterium]MDA0927310.1 MAPEG family protein [Pseudomonadota bacterium]